MTTATQPRTLADEFAERWRTREHPGDCHFDDGVECAANDARLAMVGEYYQTEDGNAPPLAHAWIDQLNEAAMAAAKKAWDEHVVPAIIEALLPLIPTAPAYLAAFPGSEQLRDDLALVPA